MEKWKPKNKEELLQLLQTYKTKSAIAKVTGFDEKSVRRWISGYQLDQVGDMGFTALQEKLESLPRIEPLKVTKFQLGTFDLMNSTLSH